MLFIILWNVEGAPTEGHDAKLIFPEGRREGRLLAGLLGNWHLPVSGGQVQGGYEGVSCQPVYQVFHTRHGEGVCLDG